MSRVLFISLALFSACSSPPTVTGFVVDTWDNPIANADVKVTTATGTERVTTDDEGRFSVPDFTGKATMLAAAEGHIPNGGDYTVAVGVVNPLVMSLYPRPTSDGFFAIGSAGFLKIDEHRISVKGSDFEALYGFEDLGDGAVQSGTLRFIFHTDRTIEQLNRVDLNLHRLSYVDTAIIEGPLRPVTISPNMWTASDDIPIEIIPIRSKSDYLIVSKEPVLPGNYAFDTQDTLTPIKSDDFEKLPKEMRIAYPFSVR
jgi:hypothetical protein